MQQMIVTKELINKYRQNEFIGSGGYADLYRYEEDKVIKLWKNKILDDDSEMEFLESALLELAQLDIKSPNFAVPEILLYDDEAFRGYIRKYIEGKNVNAVFFFKHALKNLYYLFNNLEQAVKEVSRKYKLQMCDMNCNNITFDNENNIFVIHDCDLFRKSDYFSDNELLKWNNLQINISVMSYLSSLQIGKFIQDAYLMENWRKLALGRMLLSEFFYDIITHVEEDLKSFEDIKKYTLQ